MGIQELHDTKPVLRGNIQIHPRPEGGRNLVIVCSETDVFRIPLEADTAAAIGRELALSDEEFAAELARREAASRLQVVQRNGHAAE